MHGGKFELKSRRWEGTQVTIELPPTLICPFPEDREEAPLQVTLETMTA
jgi:hypothetical protein